MDQKAAERAARDIMQHFGVPTSPMALEATPTLDRLVRLLDEERTMRMRAEEALTAAVDMQDRIDGELQFQTNRVQELWQQNDNQRQTILDLNNENRQLKWGQPSAEMLERQRQAWMAHADEHRDDYELTVQNKIPVIKSVRERFGIGLKDAKDVVDRWYVRWTDEQNARDEAERDDTGEAADELAAALAGSGVLTFEPEDEDPDGDYATVMGGSVEDVARKALESDGVDLGNHFAWPEPHTTPVEVTVTEEDIQAAWDRRAELQATLEANPFLSQFWDPPSMCPNYIAISRALGRDDIRCYTYEVKEASENIGGGAILARMPEEAQRIIELFDSGNREALQPVTYTLQMFDQVAD